MQWLELISAYMELSQSIAVHPSHNNVGVEHLAIRRDTKTKPSIGADVAAKINCLLLKIIVPVELEAFIEVCDIGIFLVEILDSS